MISNAKKPNVTYKKHHQRGTLLDIRGPPKKSGAGNGNWGVVGDEVNTAEHDLMMSSNVKNVQSSQKVRVIAQEEFEKLRNAYNTNPTIVN